MSHDKLKELTKARYRDHDLETKMFPHILEDLVGGTMDVLYAIMRTASCVGWFASDQFHHFLYDCMTKMRLRMNSAIREVKFGNLPESLDTEKLKSHPLYMEIKCIM